MKESMLNAFYEGLKELCDNNNTTSCNALGGITDNLRIVWVYEDNKHVLDIFLALNGGEYKIAINDKRNISKSNIVITKYTTVNNKEDLKNILSNYVLN